MTQQNTGTVISPLAMSDEELMNMDPSQFIQPESSESPDEQEEESPPTEEEKEVGEEEVQESQEDSVENSSEEKVEEEKEEEEEKENVQEEEDRDGEDKKDTVSEESSEEGKKTEESEIDFEAEYKKLLEPFKANGREVSVKSVDDAIALMQMGVNYNKKMAGMKPHLKLLKTLENHGLLDENEIGFLIDLKQKKPGAFEKLMKDSNIDPMDIDAEKAEGYTPSTFTVEDREIELDQVIEEIRDSPSFDRTVDLVTNKWDAKSKEEVAKFPEGLKIINALMENGAHDLIMKEMENERLFGRLQGLSDLEAYRQVGDSLHAKGAFDHLGRQGQQTPPQSKVVIPNPKKEDDSKLREKRRAASPTKTGAPSTVKQEFNPLALSDEEFDKLSMQRFL